MPPEWIHSNNDGSLQNAADSHRHQVREFEQALQRLIGPTRYNKWFAGRTQFQFQGDVLTVGLDSPFMLNWMTREFRAPAVQAAQELLGLSAQVRFEVLAAPQIPANNTGSHPTSSADQSRPPLRLHGASTPTHQPAATSPAVTAHQPETATAPASLPLAIFAAPAALPEQAEAAADQQSFSPQTNTHPPQTEGPTAVATATGLKLSAEHKTGHETAETSRPPRTPLRKRRFARLEEFVEGRCNHVALSMAKIVAEHPGEQYNPLYFYGGVGTGKTHLLEGIHAEIRLRYPELTVMYLTAESFGNFYTKSLREKSQPAFRRKFRSVDVLLVDDIEFLDAKKGMQEEFCHTLQELLAYGRQVVIAGDRHPRMLTNVRPDLCTRFLSGLVTRLESPDEQTRQGIVRQQVQKLSVPMTEEAIEYVARKFTRNPRELLGAVNCLQTQHHLTKKPIGITVAREVLRDLERECLKIVRPHDIQQAVCELFGLSTADLTSAKRNRQLVQPRMLAMYLTRQWTQAAYQEIGQLFGGRNHSTVMSAERKIKEMIDRNETIPVAMREWTAREVIAMLEEQLQVG